MHHRHPKHAPPARPAPRPNPGSRAASPQTAPTHGSGLGTALVWGGGGFIVGAIFWHAIGFWDFMTLVVLGDQESRRRQPDASNDWATQVISTPTPGRSTLRRPAVATNCTTLVIDRNKGATTGKACPPILPTVSAVLAAKTDRLPGSADQLEATVATSDPPDPAAPPITIETSSTKPLAPWFAETHPAKPN